MNGFDSTLSSNVWNVFVAGQASHSAEMLNADISDARAGNGGSR
jgi:hypothetical protein